MSTSIQQPLHQLLPTTSPIPPKLINLAASLLAQSRNRAANLKPDEEIARPYACAEIACKRLRAQLRLPPTSGRPPCKPNVYKKLLGFLEGALAETRGGSTTNTAAKATPKKRNADGEIREPRSGANTPRKKLDFTGTIGELNVDLGVDGSEAPKSVMPLVRKLCRSFSTPLLAPHVFTGTSVVLRLSAMWPRRRTPRTNTNDHKDFEDSVAALTIAVYLLVLTRMQKGEMTTTNYKTKCTKALEIAGSGDGEGQAAIDLWIRKINAEGWCREQEWLDSVPEDVMEEDGEEVSDVPDEDDDILGRRSDIRDQRKRLQQMEDDPDGVLLPGLGTMMQDAVDWLSEERREDYQQWREEILKKITQLDNKKGKGIKVH